MDINSLSIQGLIDLGVKKEKEEFELHEGLMLAEYKKCPVPPPPMNHDPLDILILDCYLGYKTGFRIGKKWAVLSVFESKVVYKEEALEYMECEKEYFKNKPFGIVRECALKGIDQGFELWWDLSHNPTRFIAEKKRIKKIERRKNRVFAWRYKSLHQEDEKEQTNDDIIQNYNRHMD